MEFGVETQSLQLQIDKAGTYLSSWVDLNWTFAVISTDLLSVKLAIQFLVGSEASTGRD